MLPPLADALASHLESLEVAAARLRRLRPGASFERRPVQVLYGGAHLFRAGTPSRLGTLARTALETHAPDGATFAGALGLELGEEAAASLRARVAAKLAREPVEDLRIDFEDGYGVRPEPEEDGDADAVARALIAGRDDGTLPPFIGIRLKPFSTAALARRGLRTLERVCLPLAGGPPPGGFAVTLPKVSAPEQVETLDHALGAVEARCGWAERSIALELMVETPEAVLGSDGLFALPRLLAAAGERCRSVHLGPYDLTSSLGITSAQQTLRHPVLVTMRQLLLLATAGTRVTVSDGPTTLLPISPHPADSASAAQLAENRAAVHRAWRRTADDVRSALADGIFQGWDLHPAQLPARFGALFAFFDEELVPASDRLRGFLERSAQATRIGAQFDDAATARGLLNALRRARACGAASGEALDALIERARQVLH